MLTTPRPCTMCRRKATHSNLCAEHYRSKETRRGSSSARGYDQAHREQFRAPVLERDNHVCQMPKPAGGICGAPADVADHWPTERKELVRRGENPNDPRHGRALCRSCHASRVFRR